VLAKGFFNLEIKGKLMFEQSIVFDSSKACHIIKISSRSIDLNFKYPIKLNGFSKDLTLGFKR
jgi:hypothetical protein